jgi:hypothetical protein
MVKHRRQGCRVLLVFGLASVLGSSGCVERRYTIRTDPPGALAIVNSQEMGMTPVSANFTYYGNREIVLIKDGYETRREIQPIKAPWWDNLLTEFFTENLIPIHFRDERDYTYALTPTQIPDQNELLGRAEGLRTEAQVPPPPRRGGILGWLGF